MMMMMITGLSFSGLGGIKSLCRCVRLRLPLIRRRPPLPTTTKEEKT